MQYKSCNLIVIRRRLLTQSDHLPNQNAKWPPVERSGNTVLNANILRLLSASQRILYVKWKIERLHLVVVLLWSRYQRFYNLLSMTQYLYWWPVQPNRIQSVLKTLQKDYKEDSLTPLGKDLDELIISQVYVLLQQQQLLQPNFNLFNFEYTLLRRPLLAWLGINSTKATQSLPVQIFSKCPFNFSFTPSAYANFQGDRHQHQSRLIYTFKIVILQTLVNIVTTNDSNKCRLEEKIGECESNYFFLLIQFFHSGGSILNGNNALRMLEQSFD